MNEKNIIDYYNKFNENKRLTRRHGIVEYTTSMKYILKYLKKIKNPKIIDIGAGTGKYSIELANMGYDVTAIELVKHNLMTLKEFFTMKRELLSLAFLLNLPISHTAGYKIRLIIEYNAINCFKSTFFSDIYIYLIIVY